MCRPLKRRLGWQLDQTLFDGESDSVCGIGCVEPVARAFDMEAHRTFGDAEQLGNLVHGFSH